MGYKTGYEMRAAAPLLGSLTLPRRCPRSDRGQCPPHRADDLGQTVGSAHHTAPMTSVRPWASTTRSGRSAGGCIRHGVSQTDHIGGAGDGVN